MSKTLYTDILPNVDSTRSLGSTDLRWLKLWVDEVTVDTLVGVTITGTSFVIAAHTLSESEFHYLDGIDQALLTTSSPIFGNSLTLGDGVAGDPRITFNSGNDGYIEWQEDELQFHIEGGVEINGWLTMGGAFFPRVLHQSSAPTAGTGTTQVTTGEFAIWEDHDNTETWLVYNREGTVKGIKVENL